MHCHDLKLAKLAVDCRAANCLKGDLDVFYKKDVDKLVPQVKSIRIYYEESI